VCRAHRGAGGTKGQVESSGKCRGCNGEGNKEGEAAELGLGLGQGIGLGVGTDPQR